MKLTLNRTEETEGLFKKSVVYYLHIDLVATPEEMILIKKHKWDNNLLFAGVAHTSGRAIPWTIGNIIGKPDRFGFRTVEHLADAERQVIENAKTLKQQLAAAAGFTSGGPRDVEL
jgi:hypothetical protein